MVACNQVGNGWLVTQACKLGESCVDATCVAATDAATTGSGPSFDGVPGGARRPRGDALADSSSDTVSDTLADAGPDATATGAHDAASDAGARTGDGLAVPPADGGASDILDAAADTAPSDVAADSATAGDALGPVHSDTGPAPDASTPDGGPPADVAPVADGATTSTDAPTAIP